MTELVTRFRCDCGFTDYVSHRNWENHRLNAFKWMSGPKFECPKCKAAFDVKMYNETVIEGMLIVGEEKSA